MELVDNRAQKSGYWTWGCRQPALESLFVWVIWMWKQWDGNIANFYPRFIQAQNCKMEMRTGGKTQEMYLVKRRNREQESVKLRWDKKNFVTSLHLQRMLEELESRSTTYKNAGERIFLKWMDIWDKCEEKEGGERYDINFISFFH